MLPPDTPPLTISEALARAARRLAPMEDRRLDAEVLLASVMGKPRTHLIAWPDKLLSQTQQETFERLVERRLSGEPAAYLTGEREFWSLKLRVTEDTLIPRPETETLVQRALELIPKDTAWIIADLGTGSGAIAAAIASERPRCRLIATDISGAALGVAAENFRKLGLHSDQQTARCLSIGKYKFFIFRKIAIPIHLIIDSNPISPATTGECILLCQFQRSIDQLNFGKIQNRRFLRAFKHLAQMTE